jgi:proteasome lid subunit RPN8/RPN11/predicted ThiF/HesA family dinucleotide-utilizing enzyme
MSAVEVSSLPEGQQEALEALHAIARASDGALTIDLDYEQAGGVLNVRVYLSSASLMSSEQGAVLEDWEPIDIAIPARFPYKPPIASTGRGDFPEIPHQAWGSGFCVRVEDSNWDPRAGMAGFLRSVINTYQHIALGTLEGHLQSWRPIISFLGQGCVVIRADLAPAGRIEPETSLRWTVGVPVGEDRIDIIRWLDAHDDGRTVADPADVLADELARIKAAVPDAFLVPAVVVAEPIALEYCDIWVQLVARLQNHGVDRERLLGHLARAAAINQTRDSGQERGMVLFRVAADTPSAVADQDARFAITRLNQDGARILADFYAAVDEAGSLDQLLEGDTDAVEQLLASVLEVATLWVQVYDGRPESIRSRTARRPTGKLAGTTILLLGCGGLGAPIAEHCVRSGAARLHIVDSGTVSPGILSRQPYEDADIGKLKAEVLAARLSRIYPGNEITASDDEITASDIFSASALAQYDLIIDATANRAVATMIERSRRDEHAPWPTLVTVAINEQATHGVAAVTPRGAVGAGIDLLRRLGLRTSMSVALDDVYAAFFPPYAGRLNFRPDTSCSDTTFIGSPTDMGALAAQLLDSALARLATPLGTASAGAPRRSLSIVRLGRDDGLKAARVVLDLPHDTVVTDHRQVYEVRIDETAMETIRGYVRASANGRNPGAGHTGGLLLGQFDSACRIAWVSQATGLPRGSTASSLKIELDPAEVRGFLEECRRQSGGMRALIGFWHTHPGGSVAPSEEDRATMRERVAGPEWPTTPALLLVLGIPGDGSVGDPSSPWTPEIHAETFVT